jgi:tetratricopeptide (TPR) repeat protein
MKIAAALLFLASAAWAGADDATSRFREANAAYGKGDFAAAKDAYERLAAEGWGGTALYENAGDACYRLGQAGRARLWYERALAADPGNEDARHDRDVVLARLQITDEDPAGPLAPWTGAAAGLFTTAGLLFFGLLTWGLFHRGGEALWWGRLAAGVLWLGAGVFFAAAQNQAATPAAVATGRLEARAGPGENQPVSFVVPEGRRLALLESAGDWVAVGLPSQGLKGWVRRGEAEPVALPLP